MCVGGGGGGGSNRPAHNAPLLAGESGDGPKIPCKLGMANSRDQGSRSILTSLPPPAMLQPLKHKELVGAKGELVFSLCFTFSELASSTTHSLLQPTVWYCGCRNCSPIC